jgi:pyruvate kinase
MSMARINLSHGNIKSNLKLINKFKQAKRLRPHKTCGLMLEVRGREIRLSEVSDENGELHIKPGAVLNVNCVNPNAISDDSTLYTNCDAIQRYLKPNDVVYIDDGKVVAVVLEVSNEGCIIEVKIGGEIHSNSQIRFIGGKHQDLSVLHPKDISDIKAISKVFQIDFLSIPFSSSGDDIK